jgi:hypothetical protein
VGLKRDLIIAKIRGAQATNEDFELDEKTLKTYTAQSEYETKAILNFLTNPELKMTVENLKASVEIEAIETTDSLDANIKMTRTLSMMAIYIKILKILVGLILNPFKWAADREIAETKPLAGLLVFIAPIDEFFRTIMSKLEAMIPATEGQGEIEIPALELKKSGGQGAALKATGHAYIGLNDPVPDSDTQVEAPDNDFTSVVLLEDNIPRELIDGVESGSEDYDVNIAKGVTLE